MTTRQRIDDNGASFVKLPQIRRIGRQLAFVALVSTLAACETLFPGLSNSAVVAPSPTPIVVAPPQSADPTITSAATEVTPPSPLPTPTLLPQPTAEPSASDWLTDAWQNNTPLSEIEWQLDQSGLLMPAVAQANGTTGRGIIGVDLTGDGRDEWLLTLIVPGSLPHQQITPTQRAYPGNFLVIGEGGILYQHFEHGTISADLTAAPFPVALTDWNGDGITDLLIDELGHNGREYFGRYYLLTADGNRLVDRTSADLQQVRWQPSISEPATGSPPAFKLRSWFPIDRSRQHGYWLLERVAWQNDGLVIVTQSPENPYRYHLLIEANSLDDIAAASELYHQVATDESIPNAPFVPSEATDLLKQIATFRLLYFEIVLSDILAATEWYTWMASTYPQTPITNAAQAMIESAELGSTPAASCSAAQSSLAADGDLFVPIQSLDSSFSDIKINILCSME